MNDFEISKKANLLHISDIAKKFEIDNKYLIPYGKYKAKIDFGIMKELEEKNDGKLILVTSINPTPLGEGKTTISIGLSDALNQIGKKSILALREPSLGPVFGMKGGATGGGYAQIAPMDEINLHFTGDIHCITSANNLISAMIDNHIYFGNNLGFEKVTWKRCMDLNDRALRKIQVGLSEEKNMVPREDGFDITVASEIMAILCLSTDIKDFERRVANIIIGFDKNEKPIRVSDINAQGAVTALMKDALNPNIVQTLENNLAFVHGGPFANIAHGCNSVIATKMALKLGDYVITEAGFGADLGAEKFVNIKCRKAGLKPSAAVCVATLKALKYHGGAAKEECEKENIAALENGMLNLFNHIENIQNEFGIKTIVALNKFSCDTDKEINFLTEKLAEKNIVLKVAEVWEKGGKGAIELAEEVVKNANEENIKFVYDDNDKIFEKIEKVAKKVYGASQIEISEKAKEQIEKIENLGYSDFPICIAKTQYSFSDDPKNLECKEPFTIHITEVDLKTGAEFIVVKTGKIFTMPGLPRVPAAEGIFVNHEGEIEGIF